MDSNWFRIGTIGPSVHLQQVVTPDGKPVAAPCAISGCQYGVFEALVADLDGLVEQMKASDNPYVVFYAGQLAQTVAKHLG